MSLMNALRSPSRFGGVSPVEMAMTLIVQRGISIGPVGPQELQYRNKLQAVVVGIKRRSLGLRTPNVHGGRQDDDAKNSSNFGERRSTRQDQRRGSRPAAKQQTTSRSQLDNEPRPSSRGEYGSTKKPGVPQGAPIRSDAEDAAYSPVKPRSTGARSAAARSSGSRSTGSRSSGSRSSGSSSSQPQIDPSANMPESAPSRPSSSFPEAGRSAPRSSRPRDNSSRFDD